LPSFLHSLALATHYNRHAYEQSQTDWKDGIGGTVALYHTYLDLTAVSRWCIWEYGTLPITIHHQLINIYIFNTPPSPFPSVSLVRVHKKPPHRIRPYHWPGQLDHICGAACGSCSAFIHHHLSLSLFALSIVHLYFSTHPQASSLFCSCSCLRLQTCVRLIFITFHTSLCSVTTLPAASYPSFFPRLVTIIKSTLNS